MGRGPKKGGTTGNKKEAAPSSNDVTTDSDLFHSLSGLLPYLSTASAFSSVSPAEVKPLLLKAMKELYDYEQAVTCKKLSPLDELIIDGLDPEQIWGEVELQTVPLLKSIEKRMQSLETLEENANSVRVNDGDQMERDRLESEEDIETEDELDEENSDDNAPEDNDDDLDNGALEDYDENDNKNEVDSQNNEKDVEEEEEADEQKEIPKKKLKKKSKNEEDLFFDMEEMERFVNEAEMKELESGGDESDEDEEEKEQEPEEEEGDEFDFDTYRKFAAGDDDLEEEEEEDMLDGVVDVAAKTAQEEEEDEYNDAIAGEKYNAFFDPPKKSKFQTEQERKQEIISKLEHASVKSRGWQLKGEVGAADRPKGSLLTEDLEFQHATRPAPVISEDITQSLEDLIKKRIVDESYDDVERRKLKDPVQEQNNGNPVNDEKSKLSLAEIYEQQYMEKSGKEEKQKSEIEKKRDEITVLFKSLCHQINALTNFHFTPDPVIKMVETKANVPSIQVEEATNSTFTAGSTLAPEQIYDPKSALPKNKSEMEQDEKKALRRAKKIVYKKRKRQEEADKKVIERINPGMGNKFAKEKALHELKKARAEGTNIEQATISKDQIDYSSSNAVFRKIQEEARKEINLKAGRTNDNEGTQKKKKGKISTGGSSAKHKL